MATPLNVLIVEDSQDDADMLLIELRRAGFDPKWKRVDTEPDFLAEIKTSPDLVLSDYSMPQFDGLRAAQLLQESGLDIPFILISGTVGEELAVNAMRHGASDYLLKDRITRLGVAVERALEQKRLRAERRQMNEQIALQAAALATAANGVMITNRRGEIQWVNPAFTATTGYTLGEVFGKTPRLLKSGMHDEAFDQEFWKAILSEKTWRGEFANRRKDGTLFYDEATVTPVKDATGKITHFIGIMHDVTARRQAEEEVRQAEAQFRGIFENAVEGIVRTTPDGRILTANPAFARMLGWESAEAMLEASLSLGRDVYGNPEDRAGILKMLDEQGVCNDFQCPFKRKDGQLILVSINARPMRDATGKIQFYDATCMDITERKRAEEAVQESETRFRQLAENVNEVFWITDLAKDKMLYISPAYETVWGRSCQSLYASPMTWLDAIHPGDRERVLAAAMTQQSRGSYSEIYRILHASGTIRWIHDRAFPIRDELGKVYRIVGVAEDITQRKHAELRIGVQQMVTSVLAEAAPLAETMKKIIEVICRQLEWDVGEMWVVDQSVKRMKCLEIWHPPSTEFREFADSSRKTVYAMEEGLPGQVWASREPTWIPDIAHYTSVKRLQEAAALGLHGAICIPVKLKGEVLGAVKCFSASAREPDGELLVMFAALGTQIGQFIERKQLEKQFLQAQKMEAIGTLAGGIAHDFNNILAAINGHTELARMDAEGHPEIMESLARVADASRRATDLVRQILAFSRRHEQMRAPTQLRPLVDEALKLLRASIPATIQFKLLLYNDAPVVLADPSQIHQVIMNLCTNAWHAMKDRAGCLSVKLAKVNVSPDLAEAHPGLMPGCYAVLTVSDTGKGMDKATMDHIFEPFFTTKGPGEGTGLGLSVVHGIMQGHDGVITVTSQPGVGTTFELYFPAHSVELPELKAHSMSIPRGNGERILLVDDEEALVRLGKKMLERLGYRVESATRAAIALAMVRERPGRFQLVITDLTMPEMTGVDLAKQLLMIRPDLPIILNTGYSASLKTDHVRDLGIRELLLKPLTMESLGTAVHRVLTARKETD